MEENQKNIVIGTAGHVDHGKTALVKALTGIDTDGLKEEKERGMTIEPGFAYLKLPSGKVVSIVDVPGHERFIRNMLRGISEVDAVLLVVAADDGVMPQTHEHLGILRLLGIEHGLIILSKIDLVDKETLEMAKEDIAGLVRGTFLEHAPLLPCSSKTGEGIEEIKRSIENLVEEISGKSKKGLFRLPIDRVFTLMGYGTVVTGTILSGKISLGEEIRLKISSSLDPQLFESALRELFQDHQIMIQKGKIKLAGFQKRLNTEQQFIYDKLDGLCKWYHFRPLPLNVLKRMKDQYGEKKVEAVVKLMVGEGKLIQLNNHRLIHSEAVEEIKNILKDYIGKNGQITLGESMQVLGVGRTQTQPIFDYLDSIRFTIRIGDYRILRGMLERRERIPHEIEKVNHEEIGEAR